MSDNSKDTLFVGGTVSTFGWGENGGIGAMTGTIDGVGYAKATGEFKELEGGVIQTGVTHYFLDKDGSVIHTTDKCTIRPDPNGDPHLRFMENVYTVVWGTGRFAGYKGSFSSRGWMRSGIDGLPEDHSAGGLRYEGVLYRD